MALQFRRGNAADLPAAGAEGEPLFVVNEGKLYVGTGSGRVLIAGSGSGEDGADGREVELQTSATHIQWRYVGDSAWTNLVALSAITGPAGAPGDDGADGSPGSNGREVQLQSTATHIQWRYVGDTSWNNLVPLADITGPAGAEGQPGTDGNDASLPAATPGQTGYLAWDGSQWVFQSDDGGGPNPDADFDLAFLSTQNLDPADSPPPFDEAAVSIEGGPAEIADTSALRIYTWSNNEGDSNNRYLYYGHRNTGGDTSYTPEFVSLDGNDNPTSFTYNGVSIGNVTIDGETYRAWQIVGNPAGPSEGVALGVR